MWQEIIGYAIGIDVLEFAGLIFGLLAVWFLIRQNILTWPAGIIYILISFVIFWRVRLYGDFILHVFFLVLNIYGWYYWLHGRKNNKEELPVTTFSLPVNLLIALVTALGVWGFWSLGSCPALLGCYHYHPERNRHVANYPQKAGKLVLLAGS